MNAAALRRLPNVAVIVNTMPLSSSSTCTSWSQLSFRNPFLTVRCWTWTSFSPFLMWQEVPRRVFQQPNPRSWATCFKTLAAAEPTSSADMGMLIVSIPLFPILKASETFLTKSTLIIANMYESTAIQLWYPLNIPSCSIGTVKFNNEVEDFYNVRITLHSPFIDV